MALPGKVTRGLTSATNETPLPVTLLLPGTGSTTVLVPDTLKTKPPVPTGTLMVVVYVPPDANVTGARVCVTPLTTTVGVKVLALGPWLVNVTVALTVVPATALAGSKTKACKSEKAAKAITDVTVLLVKLSSGQLLLPVSAATVVDVPLPSSTVVTVVSVVLGARVMGAKVVVLPSTTSVGVKVAVTKPGLLKVTVADTVPPGTPLGGNTTKMPTSAGGTITPDTGAAVALALTASVRVRPALANAKAAPLVPA